MGSWVTCSSNKQRPNVTINVDNFIDPAKIVKDVEIASQGGFIPSDEYDRQPGLVFHYIAATAKAERQLSSLKLRLEMAEADAAERIRSEAAAAGEKMTVDAVKTAVRKDKNVTQYDIAVIKAQEVLTVIKGACTALQNKKDMLIMRGHQTRDEIKARLSVDGDLSNEPNPSIQSREEKVRQRVASLKQS